MRLFALKRWLALGLLGSAAGGCTLPDGATGAGVCGPTRPAPDIGPWDSDAAAFEQRVIALTNERRASGGCCGAKGCFGPSVALKLNDNLRVAARRHAADMAARSYFSHESPEGGTLGDRLARAGFGGCSAGENIAQGQRDPEAVVEAWMGSEGHCANILAPRYRAMGVGYVDDPAVELRRVWVQNFGG